jgi:hypothetical protein
MRVHSRRPARRDNCLDFCQVRAQPGKNFGSPLPLRLVSVLNEIPNNDVGSCASKVKSGDSH